jgi:FkbM family methyltransferase
VVRLFLRALNFFDFGTDMNPLEVCRFLHRAWRYQLKVETAEIQAVRQHISPGDTVIDIGAHKGAFTYWMSRSVGPRGRVLAFEPQPELADYLKRAISQFRLKNVEVIETALSNRSGTATLYRATQDVSPGASLEVDPSTAGDSFEVQIRPLDEILNERNIETVGLIKCDAEGHELKVFQGGSAVLSRCRPHLLFECETQHHWGRSIQVVFDYLYDLGYSGAFFDEGKILQFPGDGTMTPEKLNTVFNYWFQSKEWNQQSACRAA